MNDLNHAVEELANFWDELHREDDNLTAKLEELFGKEKTDQLNVYIQEIENYNEEIDVDNIINEIDEARSHLEDVVSTAQDAINSLDYAIGNAEDLR